MRIGEFLFFIDGVYSSACRKTVWMKIVKSKIKSLESLAKILIRLYKAEISKIEKIQITIFIDKTEPIE